MILKNKYVIGCHIMWYEIEMVQEYVDSIISAINFYEVNNPENITVHICWNLQEYLERVDTTKIVFEELTLQLSTMLKPLQKKCKVELVIKSDLDAWYNIAAYRRELNDSFCELTDFVIWGETDSLFPEPMFQIIEELSSEATNNGINKYIVNFADRKNWDSSWDEVTHPKFRDVPFVDTEEWSINNEASSKSYMTAQRMNEINNEAEEIEVKALYEPKFDGSCLVISSQLIMAGVNIPRALIHCGEDTAFGVMAKKILGGQFMQYCVINILRVHNRRHPNKRSYILNENNPRGFCGDRKGDWWNVLESASKYNMNNLFNQIKFHLTSAVINSIKK